MLRIFSEAAKDMKQNILLLSFHYLWDSKNTAKYEAQLQ